jgi:hypothetical protein
MIVTKVEPVINLKAAKVFGVTFPLTPLARTGEVIERRLGTTVTAACSRA